MEGRVTGLDFAGKALYLAVKNGGIRIMDISDPVKPQDRGRYDAVEATTVFYFYDLEIREKTLRITGHYRHDYSSMETVDISDPWHPKQIGMKTYEYSPPDEEETKKTTTTASTSKMPVEEKISYESPFKDLKYIIPVASNLGCAFIHDKLSTIDLADPDSPKIVGSIPLQGGSAIARGKTIIVHNAQGIHFIDISDPRKPVSVGTIPIKDKFDSFGVDWPYALVTSKDMDLTIYDLTDLKQPRLASHFTLSHPCKNFELANQRAYVACLDLQIINLTDLAHPKLEGIVHCEDPEEAENAKVYEGFRARDVALCGHYAYCEASCVDISNPQIPKIVGNDKFVSPWGIGMNVYIRGSLLQVFGGWGIQSIESNDHDEENVGTEMDLYNLSDPVHPREAYSLQGLDEDATILGDRLYLESEMSGVIILKIKSKARPEEPTKARNSADEPRFLNVMENAKIFSDFSGLKQIKIAGELACGRQGDRTLLTIDLTKSAQPRLLGRCDLSGPFGAMAIDGNTLFAGGTDGTIYTVDISKPTTPIQRATFKLEEAPQAMAASKGRLYVATGKLKIIDISKPERLSELGTYASSIPCTDLTTSGTIVYLAARGLEIVDTANPAKPLLRYRFPSFPALGNRVLTYDYGQANSSMQEVKRLGNIVYLIAISSAEATKCQMPVFDVTNPDKPQGCGKEIDAKGEDIDLKPQPENLESNAATKYSGWLIGLPIKTRTVNADRAGMMFYDLSDPARPIFMGAYEGLTNPRKPVLYKNLVYLTDDKLGLVILKPIRSQAKMRK